MAQVFVPTWNSEKTLTKCLHSIRESFPDADITLIDNYSTDKTIEIAKEFNVKVRAFAGNLGQVRQAMCKVAAGEWFIMIDSDVYISKSWFAHFVTQRVELLLIDDRVGAVQGLNIPMYEPHRSWFILQQKRRKFPERNEVRLLTSNVLLRRDAVKGFKCSLPLAEDYMLGKYIEKRGYNWYVTDKATAEHDNPNLTRHQKSAGAGIAITSRLDLKKLAFGIFHLYSGLRKTPKPLKVFYVKMSLNWLMGAINSRKYLRLQEA